jgi:hypothetical protein
MTALMRVARLSIVVLGTVLLAGPAATETPQPTNKPILTVILALKRDGEYMPVRDKGPLFIIYPYDNAPELRSQQFYSRSVWQVSRLVVK